VARWIRKRRLAVVVCLMLGIPGAMVVSEKFLTDIHIEEPFEWDMRLAARATMDIKDLLGVIGHGVTVSSVRAKVYDGGWAAAYFWDRRVLVDARHEFSNDTLLLLMGHECSHAMFRQGGFLREDANLTSYQAFANEVAADVFGAHLAGRVVSRRGGDGEALTANLLEESRIVRRIFTEGDRAMAELDSTEWDRTVRTSLGEGIWLDPREGADRLVDIIDRICRQNDDLWEAARTFANEIYNVDENTAKRLVPAWVFREKPERNDDE